MSSRLLGFLVALYPPRWRKRFGAALRVTLLDRLDEARSEGWASEARYWTGDVTRLVLDLVPTWFEAMSERGSGRRGVMKGWGQDLKWAWGSALRNGRFTALAAITLGLGIGATTVVFSVADGVVFSPLAFERPDELVVIRSRFGDMEFGSQSLPNILDVKGEVASLRSIVGTADASPALTGEGDPERVEALLVTEGYFPFLGAEPALGRGFTPEDHEIGAAPVVVVSDGIWNRRWGGDVDVIGRTLRLDGEVHTVVGVMPFGFHNPQIVEPTGSIEIWSPLRPDHPDYAGRGSYALTLMGRLAPGTTLEEARAELAAIGSRLTEAFPDDNAIAGRALELVPYDMKEQTIGEAGRPVLLLFGAVAVLLLIACANVGNLFLVRGTMRQGEFEIRRSLGAGRPRLFRQLLAEGTVTAFLAVAVGLGFTYGGLALFKGLSPGDIPRLSQVAVDSRVLMFALAISAITILLFGVAPLLHAGRGADAVRSWGRASDGRSLRALRSGLVAAEVALAVILVTGAGLLVNSFVRVSRMDPGYESDGVLTIRVRPPVHTGDGEPTAQFYRQLLERVQGLPGVEGGALVQSAPAQQGGSWNRLTVEGAVVDPDAATEFVRANPVEGPYFDLLDIPVLAGRGFTDRDASVGGVAIVNQSAAEKFWPGRSPLGMRLKQGGADGEAPWLTVVGVVGDVSQRGGRREPEPEWFFPYGPDARAIMTVVAKVRAGMVVSAGSIAGAVHEIDSDLPVDRIVALDDQIRDGLVSERFYTVLLGLFGGLALALSTVGVYGSMAYSVSRRARDVGIRMALGAKREDVVKMVLRQGMTVATIGLGFGVLGAVATGRLLEGMLYGVAPADPLTLAAAVALLATCAWMACYAPAARAARMNPRDVLHVE